MATVGDQLTAPETGWRRYDDNYPFIVYFGSWSRNSATDTGLYNNNHTYSPYIDRYIKFKFVGSKLRIISFTRSDFTPSATIKIDGQSYEFSEYRQSGSMHQVIVFEILSLPFTEHDVEIRNNSSGYQLGLDAIDIDDTGRLLHPDEVTDIKDLDIGKRIRCHYTATSNRVGAFNGLGEETSDFIPSASSATPNGDFYWICVDKDFLGRWKLFADRNIQSGISWDTLNNSGIASGLPVYLDFSDNVCVGGEAISGGNNGANTPDKAFDGVVPPDNSAIWASSQIGAGVNGVAWIGYRFAVDRKVEKIKLVHTPETRGTVSSVKIQGSEDGETWDDIFTANNLVVNVNIIVFNNNTAYRYYRLMANSAVASGWTWNVKEIEMYEGNTEKGAFMVRLPTGGVSNTDKDNEWDKYIVNSTLNGTITAGDNNVWNWNGIASWTSTTSTNSASNRMRRGYTAVGNYTDRASSYADSINGFRPVLLVIVSPLTFEGSVDRPSIHDENVTLTGTISHSENRLTKYRILVNGAQEYPETGFTALAPPPISVNYTISNSKFRLGSNQITVEMVDDEGAVGTWTTTVTLDSQAPTITASMAGMLLDVNIRDPETDSVRFRVLLNGNQVHPSDPAEEFTNLVPPPITYQRLFRSNEVIIGSNNTVTIIAQDQFGKESTLTLNFIGEYAGLMFADEAGDFYSDDLGNILQYLDVGILVAGQISETYPVRLINKTGFTVTNIQLWKDRKNLPPSAEVQISKTETPFVPVDLLEFDTPLQYNDEVTFYVRVVTQINGQPGQGEFDVFVKADPT